MSIYTVIVISTTVLFTFATIFPGSVDSSVVCKNFNQTNCCLHPECFYINCTDKANKTAQHTGCHGKENKTVVVTNYCKPTTDEVVCEGPEMCEEHSGNETACCEATATLGCMYYTCSNKVQPDTTVSGCHNSTDIAIINATCVDSTAKETCAAPTPEPADTCESHGTNQTACCDLTSTLSCMFYTCKDKADPTKTHTGCHNSTDTNWANGTCAAGVKPIESCEGPTPQPAETCSNFTDKGTCCSKEDLKCVFVNCTGTDKKTYSGCYGHNKTQCGASLVDFCSTPTPAVITTPRWQACESYKDESTCCGNLYDKCIYVNCTTAKLTGCFGAANASSVQTKCGTEYYDSCTPNPTTQPLSTTTPSAPTPAPHGSGSHFDGASFIGGIILCAGIIVIIFFIRKWYQSRQEANYHTL